MLLELGSVRPSYVIALGKSHNKLVFLRFRTLEDGFDLDDRVMPVRIVFRDAMRHGSDVRCRPRANIRDLRDDHEVRRSQPLLQFLITGLLLNLSEYLFLRAGSATLSAAGPHRMTQFLHRNPRTKDPAVRIKGGLHSRPKSTRVFHLNRYVVALFQRNSRRLFQHGLDANYNRLRRFRNLSKRGGPQLADCAGKYNARLLHQRRLVPSPLRKCYGGWRQQAALQHAAKQKSRMIHGRPLHAVPEILFTESPPR